MECNVLSINFLNNESNYAELNELREQIDNQFENNSRECIKSCRALLDKLVEWMYKHDESLESLWSDNLSVLLSNEKFKKLISEDLLSKINYVDKCGKQAVRKINAKRDQAELCIQNINDFISFIAYKYFGHKTYSSKKNPLDLCEYETRKIYVDTMLQDAGWIENKDWINEYEIFGMPNKSGVGYADYVLADDNGDFLAVVEVKRTCKSVEKGRQQAKLYADLIEKKQSFRPVIFLSNGFDTRIIDNIHQERKIACIYSKRDLQKFFNLQRTKESLNNIHVDKGIAGRYYQKAAIKAVCDSFYNGNKRKALLVMATGSGKTRTVIALVKVLRDKG